MVNSYFDLVEASLREIEGILNTRYPPTGESQTETAFDRLCRRDLSTHHDAELTVIMEYASLKVIWSHRTGNKAESKVSVKMVHHLYDLPRLSRAGSSFNSGILEVGRSVQNRAPKGADPACGRRCRQVLVQSRFSTCLATSILLSPILSRVWRSRI